MIAILQFLYCGDVKFICIWQISAGLREDQFMSVILTVFWDNVLHFFSEIFWSQRHCKLCTSSAEGLAIKCDELIMLN